MSDDSHDDLYQDIEVSDVINSIKYKSNSKRSSSAPLSLHEENEALKVQIQRVQQENEHLKRNIGTLYRTAKAELERKDEMIQRLEQDLITAAATTNT